MDLGDAVGAFVAGYFSTCRRSAKTQAAYQIDLNQFQTYIGAAQPLAGIESTTLEEWANSMRADGYAAVSIRRKFATARVFFSYWVRKRVLDRSPLWQIRLDLGRERVLPRSLQAGDAKRILEAVWKPIDPSATGPFQASDRDFVCLRNLAALEILFATGIRVGELVSLSLKDWREDDCAFLVRGKGSRQRLAFLPDDRSLRAVRLYLRHRKALSLEDEALLLNTAGHRISTQGIARILRETAATAEVDGKVTPHMIRHTVATLLLRYGADIRIVQEVLGHASIATTQRYTHVSKEHLISTLHLRHPNHHLVVAVPA